MADPRFFQKAGPFALADLAGIAEAELSSDADGSRRFADVAPLDRAGADQVSFLDNRKYVDAFKSSAAGACVAHPDMAGHAPAGMALLLTRTPYKAFALVSRAFYPRATAVPARKTSQQPSDSNRCQVVSSPPTHCQRRVIHSYR